MKIDDQKEKELREQKRCPCCFQKGVHNELDRSENGLYCPYCSYGEHCDGYIDRDRIHHSYFGDETIDLNKV